MVKCLSSTGLASLVIPPSELPHSTQFRAKMGKGCYVSVQVSLGVLVIGGHSSLIFVTQSYMADTGHWLMKQDFKSFFTQLICYSKKRDFSPSASIYFKLLCKSQGQGREDTAHGLFIWHWGGGFTPTHWPTRHQWDALEFFSSHLKNLASARKQEMNIALGDKLPWLRNPPQHADPLFKLGFLGTAGKKTRPAPNCFNLC